MHGYKWIMFLMGPEFSPVRNYFFTMCGATALYLFSLTKGFRGSTPVLRRLLPSRSDVFYDRVDFVVVIVLGSVIGTVFFVPSNATQALSAGFGWIAAVNVLSSPSPQHQPIAAMNDVQPMGDPR
jgi:hypothetical protein